MDADTPGSLPDPTALPSADGDALDRAAELLRGAERPVVMAGTGLYWAHGEDAPCALRGAPDPRVPQRPGAGRVPADHPMFFTRAGRG